MSKAVLIIMAKNPVLGKVKTRLATDIGEDAALSIYREMLFYTISTASKAIANQFVFFSDFEDPLVNILDSEMAVQEGNNLGERMANAQKKAFDAGAEKVVIIGADCLELTTETLNKSFDELEKAEVVIGPAVDGGYYLIGSKSYNPVLFENINWSTDKVFAQTREKLELNEISFALLEELSDIDTMADLSRNTYLAERFTHLIQ